MNGVIRHNGLPVILKYDRDNVFYFLSSGTWGLKSTKEHIGHVFNLPKFILDREEQPNDILGKINEAMRVVGLTDKEGYSSIYEFLMDIKTQWSLIDSRIGDEADTDQVIDNIVMAAMSIATGILEDRLGLLSLALLEPPAPVLHSSWIKANKKIGESIVYSRIDMPKAREIIEDMDTGNEFSVPVRV